MYCLLCLVGRIPNDGLASSFQKDNFSLFSSRCIYGIADVFSLSVLALVTLNVSLWRVFMLCWFAVGLKGNMLLACSFLTQLLANFSDRLALLSKREVNPVSERALLYER